MIGTYADAALALGMYLDYDHSMLLSADGTTRMVYLIDGIVYKVGSDSDNRWEFENITANADNLPEGVFFPKVALFEVAGSKVIAMEYIRGQVMAECFCHVGEQHGSTCMPADIFAKVRDVIDDTGGENVIVTDNGDIYIIDAAM